MNKLLVAMMLWSGVAAAAPSPLLATASMEEGLKVDSEDGRFGAQLGALFWTRASLSSAQAVREPSFAVPLARLIFKGHLVRPWISFFFQPEFAQTPRLLDLELDFHPTDAVGFKVGQYIPPFSRSFMTPPPKLEFQSFAAANEIFRTNRDTGATFYGTVLQGRLEYYLGVFNGNGINVAANENSQMMGVGRVGGTLFGKPPPARSYMRYDETLALLGDSPATLMVGMGAFANKRSFTAATADAAVPPPVTQRTAMVDAAFLFHHLFIQGEAYLQEINTQGVSATQQRRGGDLQAGYFILPGTLELATRGSWIQYDANDPDKRLRQWEGQVGYYVAGNHVKTNLRYVLTDSSAAQSGYTAGVSHALIAQLQMWF